MSDDKKIVICDSCGFLDDEIAMGFGEMCCNCLDWPNNCEADDIMEDCKKGRRDACPMYKRREST